MNTSACDECGSDIVDDDHAVVVESIPEHDRQSHIAAGNRGSWPHNGAFRRVCCASCARDIVAGDDGWSQIVTRRRSRTTCKRSRKD